jgi:predicted dehydrogenase
MKQLLQSAKTGSVRVTEVPVPGMGEGEVLLQVAASLISTGTERYLMEFTSKNLLQKAKARPDLVRQVLDKIKREGVLATLGTVRDRLDQPLTLGYSNAGIVIAVGRGISDIQPGDAVACAGVGYAVHAEVVSVPRNLLVKLPDNVDLEAAVFATLGAVALHGMRLAKVELGEIIAVIGLGLVGQITAQQVKAAGCTVAGMDIRPDRAELARRNGADAVATNAEGMASIVDLLSSGRGADAVLITADTSSSEPVELAGRIARNRGAVVSIGTVGVKLNRKAYFEKELDFRISRSYGPGRYDPEYEEKGHDYPIGYVRWTENRNMEAFVQLLAEKKVDVKPLITHRFPIEEAEKAYDLITGKTGEPSLGVLITYSQQPDLSRRVELRSMRDVSGSGVRGSTAQTSQRVTVGMLGAGNFAATTLLPAMKKIPGLELIGVCAATGLTARHVGNKFGFRYCTTSEREILNNPEVNTVVVATRHHLHAPQVLAAFNAGKHIFCEKPLCLSEDELRAIVRTYSVQPHRIISVGYNRRFAPMAQRLKTFLTDLHEPLVMHYRVNAGYLPPDHWTRDPHQGGGRIIGEVCHFVDFLIFLTGVLPIRVCTQRLPNSGRYQDDSITISLEFADGSLGTITYVANGDKTFSKERVEVFGGGAVAVLDDFRRLELVRHGHRKVLKSRLRQDKGHQGEWEAFVAAVRENGLPPIALQDIVAVSLTTFRIQEALRCGEPLKIETEVFLTSSLPSKDELQALGVPTKTSQSTP